MHKLCVIMLCSLGPDLIWESDSVGILPTATHAADVCCWPYSVGLLLPKMWVWRRRFPCRNTYLV